MEYFFLEIGRFEKRIALSEKKPPLPMAEMECALHVALPKWSLNQLKPVQQITQQVLRAYCPNIYTVPYHIHLQDNE